MSGCSLEIARLARGFAENFMSGSSGASFLRPGGLGRPRGVQEDDEVHWRVSRVSARRDAGDLDEPLANELPRAGTREGSRYQSIDLATGRRETCSTIEPSAVLGPIKGRSALCPRLDCP